MILKFISWNVNGLRALLKKPEAQWLLARDAAIIAIQETKASPDQLPAEIVSAENWHTYWDSSTVKKGYSGVGVFSRLEPIKVTVQLPDIRYQGEGRLLHLEYPRFHFFNGYFPNGGAAELDENGKPTGKFKRVPYKLGFFNAFLQVAKECAREKPVVICGDFNIAHKELDVANPKKYVQISGFLPEERAWMDDFTAAGFIDTFRYTHPDAAGQYTWWSYQGAARQKNIGWRLDYFFVSHDLAAKIQAATIYADVKGSDHCPVGLELQFDDN